jgi:hypothetical protein
MISSQTVPVLVKIHYITNPQHISLIKNAFTPYSRTPCPKINLPRDLRHCYPKADPILTMADLGTSPALVYMSKIQPDLIQALSDEVVEVLEFHYTYTADAFPRRSRARKLLSKRATLGDDREMDVHS